MSSQKRFTKAYQSAKRLAFSSTDKLILFSDCHRGDNSFADDFANNRNTYFHALKHYYDQGFTYFELGDGTELWENIDFDTILRAHKNVHDLLQRFYQEDRLHIIYGNHDMALKNQRYVEKHLYSYFDRRLGEDKPLFPGISFPEAIVLTYKETDKELFLTHGHQAEFMNSVGWRINRFLVRVLWKPLQIVGIADPTSPAKNYRELVKVERRTKQWIVENKNKLTIIGHTHRPRFPDPGDIAFFNTGSCVHPRSITGIEIDKGEISLIKWHIETKDDGTLQIVRVLLEGPTPIDKF
ncbi:hypothetical protein GCM10009117_16220 [Gangjinia marincola]|uniref:Calcineurin-like phosphoesterase domain-containing protein n=1 Tax=Gangjinia marincola TaxID=578463 RepID=A0ABP3XVN2_9FLAO